MRIILSFFKFPFFSDESPPPPSELSERPITPPRMQYYMYSGGNDSDNYPLIPKARPATQVPPPPPSQGCAL